MRVAQLPAGGRRLQAARHAHAHRHAAPLQRLRARRPSAGGAVMRARMRCGAARRRASFRRAIQIKRRRYPVKSYKTFHPKTLRDIHGRVLSSGRWFVKSEAGRASVKAATAGREGRRKALSATGFQGMRLTWLRRS